MKKALPSKSEQIAMCVLLALGLILIPLGIVLWLSLPPIGTPEYIQIDPFRKTIGTQLYIWGFVSIVLSLVFTYAYNEYLNYIILGIIILGGIYILVGRHLDLSYQTSIYYSLTAAGLGLLFGGLMDLICYNAFCRRIRGRREA
jgi:hypothetical protein